MSSPRFVRLLGVALALLVGLGVTACSDDDDGGGGGASAGDVPNTASYCDSVRAGFEIAKTAPFDQLSEEQVARFGELWVRAQQQAPPNIRNDYLQMMSGDTYAVDNINFYNESECGIDISQLPSSTTTP